MLLADLAAASTAVGATASRTAKTAVLADVLRRADQGEIAVVVRYLAGDLRQRRTGVGQRALTGLPEPAAAPSLQVLEVDAVFDELSQIAGAGSAARRKDLVHGLFGRATVAEQRLLVGLASGELRQGAQAAAVTDALAVAAGVPLAAVRSALLLSGSLPLVAEAALSAGLDGLAQFRLEVGRPLSPMLALPGADLADALAKLPSAVVEWKLDGIRVQVHRNADEVRVFTRTLDDITARVPELVDVARSLDVTSVVLDGEALALRDDGRPHPFQVTASRAATRSGGAVPLTPMFFDVLHLDGVDLVGEPLHARAQVLARVVPQRWRVPRAVADLEAFAAAALEAGHEGVVVKDLDAPYDAGRRGGAWRKVKPVHTFDLVVLAVERGHGRRTGTLSNLHLGARDPSSGGFVMLGKTFKGLTDELLAWQTSRLRELAVSDDGYTVTVRPELVVEIAVDGVQTSPRYPAGLALRFARVLRYRPDKPADSADTVDDVRRLHPG